MNLALALGLVLVSSNAVCARREILVERIDLKYLHPEFGNCSISMRKVSRTDVGISVDLTLYKDDILQNGRIRIQVYSFHNNEFRLAPLLLTRNLCTFFDMEWQVVCHDLQRFGTLPCSCPMPKGHYHLKDYVANITNTLEFPWSYFRINANISYKGAQMARLEVYVKFDRDAKLVNPFLLKL